MKSDSRIRRSRGRAVQVEKLNLSSSPTSTFGTRLFQLEVHPASSRPWGFPDAKFHAAFSLLRYAETNFLNASEFAESQTWVQAGNRCRSALGVETESSVQGSHGLFDHFFTNHTRDANRRGRDHFQVDAEVGENFKHGGGHTRVRLHASTNK